MYGLNVETKQVLRSIWLKKKSVLHAVVFWGSLLVNLRLSAIANALAFATFTP